MPGTLLEGGGAGPINSLIKRMRAGSKTFWRARADDKKLPTPLYRAQGIDLRIFRGSSTKLYDWRGLQRLFGWKCPWMLAYTPFPILRGMCGKTVIPGTIPGMTLFD